MYFKFSAKKAGMLLLVLALAFNVFLIGLSIWYRDNIYGLAALLWGFTVFMMYDRFQKKHAVLRNYPIIGRLRFLFESIRPELRQYFFESDLDGKPFNRRTRSVVYQRSKNERQTVPFGTQLDSSAVGFEWVSHSIFPVHIESHDFRTLVGGKYCTKPYNLSLLNIGAMSYGALSKTAISSLNYGANIGNFAHNTGEGGISMYHVKGGGDLIWQIGTGYFGCRNSDGTFNDVLFQKNAGREYVKMIELKLSQGAKPGHGGILPAVKNTPEIATIRNIEPNIAVISPPFHSAFNTSEGLLFFIAKLRKLSQGKPVGFKLCIGNKSEFIAICDAIKTTGITPDFITVDGSEGGTGAAPLEFSDSIGMPLLDALSFVSKTLTEYGIKEEIKIIAAGKIITGFDILKVLSLGANSCYSARGMMFALGCIQALKCDSDTCPVGVATQDKRLYKGIDINNKKYRVAHFHQNTMIATKEMMEACGFKSLSDIDSSKIYRRIDPLHIKTYQEIYFHNLNKQNYEPEPKYAY